MAASAFKDPAADNLACLESYKEPKNLQPSLQVNVNDGHQITEGSFLGNYWGVEDFALTPEPSDLHQGQWQTGSEFIDHIIAWRHDYTWTDSMAPSHAADCVRGFLTDSLPPPLSLFVRRMGQEHIWDGAAALWKVQDYLQMESNMPEKVPESARIDFHLRVCDGVQASQCFHALQEEVKRTKANAQEDLAKHLWTAMRMEAEFFWEQWDAAFLGGIYMVIRLFLDTQHPEPKAYHAVAGELLLLHGNVLATYTRAKDGLSLLHLYREHFGSASVPTPGATSTSRGTLDRLCSILEGGFILPWHIFLEQRIRNDPQAFRRRTNRPSPPDTPTPCGVASLEVDADTDDLEKEKREVLAGIREGRWRAFSNASAGVRADVGVAFEAVESSHWEIAYVSKELKDNDAIVEAAVRQWGLAIEHASPRLQDNYELMMIAVQSEGCALEHASPTLRDNLALAHAAALSDGTSLQFVSDALRADPDLVLSAMRNTSYGTTAFQYAAPSLRDNWDFIARALAVSNTYFPEHNFGSSRDPVEEDAPRRVLPFVSESVEATLQKAARLFDTTHQAQHFLDEKLPLHESFVTFHLCITSKAVPKGHRTKLLEVKEIRNYIGEFLGAPQGRDIGKMYVAKRVLPVLTLCSHHGYRDIAWIVREAGLDRNISGPFWLP